MPGCLFYCSKQLIGQKTIYHSSAMSGMLALLLLLQLAVIPFGVTAQSCNNDSTEEHCPRDSSDGFVQEKDWQNAASMYDFHANDIHGNRVSLEKYRGFVCIVVNVARDCGLTETNFKQLVDLHDKYGDSRNLKILAFPCNQFGGQEPGTAEEILDYTRDYGVKFDIFEKIKVNGADAHPLWKWLKQKQGGFLGNAIKWNFTKFVIDKNGQPVDRFAPTTEPRDLEETIKKYF